MAEPYSQEEYLRALNSNEPLGEGGFRSESLAAADAAEAQLRAEQAAEKYRALSRAREAPPRNTRAEIAKGLRAYEQELAEADRIPMAPSAPPKPAAPEPERSGLPSGLKLAPGQAGGIDMGKVTGPQVPKDYRTPEGAIPGSQIQGAQSPHNAGGRALLSIASGGATEDVLEAEAGAAEQAKGEVTERGLSGISPEEKIRAFMAATGATQQQAQQFVRVNPSWQPASRTAATGAAGIDPQSRDDMMTLQKGSEIQRQEGFEQAQEAQANQGRMLLEVQNNRLKAEEAFRRDQDSIQQRYDTERAEQMAKLQKIQDAMEGLGKQPRTIREWLDNSGTGTRLAYGLAAGLSAMGGAIGRRGNQPLQDLFNRTQSNINAKVDQEKEAFSRLGERAKLNDTVYARIRQAAGDDQAALNVTKAMYYDAIGAMVEQIATQYQLDMQSPQLLDFMAKLAKERQALIGETATKIQEQSSQTDRFNPGGVFAVGGGAASKGPSAGEKDIREQVMKFGEEMEKRGANVTQQTIEHYDNLIKQMRASGLEKDEMLWGALAQAATAKDPVKATAVLAGLPEKQKHMVSLLLQANERRLHKLSGANLTTGEVLRDMFKQGSYSIDGLQNFNRELKAEWEGIARGVEATVGGEPDPQGGSRVGNLYYGRQGWAGLTSPFVGVNGRALNPTTPGEKRARDTAKLR